MLGVVATFQDVTDYAEIMQDGIVDPLMDETAIEDVPDKDQLDEFMYGNVTVNGSQVHIIPTGKS